MTIAKKHAARYMPNGEVSLEQVIQAAIDEALIEAERVPEGWQLVPVEATPEMIDAVLGYANGDDLQFYGADAFRKEIAKDWWILLAAAPQPKKEGE